MLEPTKLLPWKLVSSQRMVARFGKFAQTDIFTNPVTGGAEEFFIIGQRDWSVTLPITVDGKVLVVREFKKGARGFVLELAGGTANFGGELPEQVAARELLEESGYKAGRVVKLGASQFMSPGASPTMFHMFLGLDCQKVAAAKLDNSEQVEPTLLPWKELWDMRYELQNPSAVIAIYRAEDYRQQHGLNW